AGRHPGDRGRVLLLRLGRLGQLLSLPVVRARRRGPGLEPRAAQGAEGVQVPPSLPLGLRRWCDVSDALLPVVWPAREVAPRRVPERLPPLQPGPGRLGELAALVRRGFHRTGPRPSASRPRAPAAPDAAE